MVKPMTPYPRGLRGDFELLQDLGEVSAYLMQMAHVLHGRIFPAMTYGRSLWTSAELEARLSSALHLMEALYPLQSCWETIGLENGPRLPLALDYWQKFSDVITSYEELDGAPADE